MTLTEHGYIIQFEVAHRASKRMERFPRPDTFATNRHACWIRACGSDRSWFERNRARWKELGARCVPATRTIETEEL